MSVDERRGAPIYSCSVSFGGLFSMFGNLFLGARVEGTAVGSKDV
jgi:hypothetical protein